MAIEPRARAALRAAAEHLNQLRRSANPYDQQSSWEAFLIHWRIAHERLTKEATAKGRSEICASFHKARTSDRALTYVWEARNAEHHSNEASTVSSVDAIHVQVSDPNLPVEIENLEIDQGGYRGSLHNAVVRVEGGRLEMKAVSAKGEKRGEIRQVEPPPGLSAYEVAAHAMGYLERYADAVSAY